MYRCKCGRYTDNGFFCTNCQPSTLIDLEKFTNREYIYEEEKLEIEIEDEEDN